jgi:hypothetical protein
VDIFFIPDPKTTKGVKRSGEEGKIWGNLQKIVELLTRNVIKGTWQ